MNDAKKVAQAAIAQAKDEGLSDEDAKWMATGALVREARTQGVIGDEVSPEMTAAALTLVQQEVLKKK